MHSTDSSGFSSLWLPGILVLCTIAVMYATEYLKGGLLIYKTFLLSAEWFDKELLTSGIPQSEECSTSPGGLQICRFSEIATLRSDTPKNIWIDWEALRSKAESCAEPCIINEPLSPIMVYDTPIELTNAYCILSECMLASSQHITIHESVISTGNITILARSDITIGSINVKSGAGALIISSQGGVRILNPDIHPRITILQAFPVDPPLSAPLAEKFTSPLTIIEGVRSVRPIE